MKDFKDLVKAYTSKKVNTPNNFPKIGETFLVDEKGIKGYYWFYETDYFIFDIHDFNLTGDVIYNEVKAMYNFFYLSSIYMFSSSGEWLSPYQAMEPATIYIMNKGIPLSKYILHNNSRFHAVSLKIKEKFLDNSFFKENNFSKNKIPSIFVETKGKISKEIEKIATEVINCKMDKLSAKLFFEAKAKEWIAISLNALNNENKRGSLNIDDDKDITSVAMYIEDHFSMNIKEDLLCKIAMMSSTKLKNTFRKKYGVSITEFTQRKRMNVAENLLLTSDLDIKTIAKTVGYTSQSRFTTLYKRYKAILPSQVRHIKNIDE